MEYESEPVNTGPASAFDDETLDNQTPARRTPREGETATR